VFVYGTYEKSPYIHTDKLNELTLVALKGVLNKIEKLENNIKMLKEN